MFARRGGRSANRRITPVSPRKPASVASVEEPRRLRASTRSQSRDIETSADPNLSSKEILEVVDEVAETVPPVLSRQGKDASPEEAFASAEEDYSDDDDEVDEPSDPEELDVENMIDQLQNLYRDSSEVLKMLDLPDPDEIGNLLAELQDVGSAARKRLEKRVRRMLDTRADFGGKLYVNPDKVCRIILSQTQHGAANPDMSGPWRPDLVFYLTNLAQLLCTMMTQPEHRIYESLQYMSINFPAPFTTEIATDPESAGTLGSSLVEETLDVNLELRTQFFISIVEQKGEEENFDPEPFLMDLFWYNDRPGGLDAPKIDQDIIQEAVNERIADIRKFITTETSHSVHLVQLNDAYPFGVFVLKLGYWAHHRRMEIEARLSELGGVESIASRLEKGEFSALSIPNHDKRSEAAGASTDESSKFKNPEMTRNVARLKQYKIALAAADSERDTAGPEPPAGVHSVSPDEHRSVIQDDDGDNFIDDDEAIQAASPSHSLSPATQDKLIFQTLRDNQRQSEKENLQVRSTKSFYDRQEGAVRVPFDDDHDEPAPASPKRRRATDKEFEDADEDDFEADQRKPKRKRTVNNPSDVPATKRRGRPRKLPLIANVEEEAEVETADGVIQASRSATPAQQIPRPRQPTRSPLQTISKSTLPQRTAPASTSTTSKPNSRRLRLEDDPPQLNPPSPPRRTQREPSSSSVYTQIQEQAKIRVRKQKEKIVATDENHEHHFSRIQQRVPYTEDEVNRLMELIAEKGTKWADMLDADAMHRDGPCLQGRSQVQLKDKARNMKMDFLKAGVRLPPGFESVSIGQKGVDMLRGLGILVDERIVRI